MFNNRYEIWFEEKIGDATNFHKAMEIATEILDTIKKYPNENDREEYMYLQIRCYHWFDKLFRIKQKNIPTIGSLKKPIRYTIVVWSEKEQKFVVNTN